MSLSTIQSESATAIAPNSAAPMLAVHDLAVSFETENGKPTKALEGTSLSVHPGQTLAVVGESGCGKSVTALSVLRLVPTPPGRYERGSVLFRAPAEPAVDLLRASEREMRRIRGGRIAMIFQEPMTSLNPVFTIGEQIAEAVRLHQHTPGRRAMEIAEEALREVGIDDARSRLADYPHQFSGGMRQRVMIAMALACRPCLLLADEPTTALDVTIQAQILELLDTLRRRTGMAMVLITHALGVVAQVAEVVCVMYAGRVVEYARVDELFARPLHPYTRALLKCIPRLSERSARLTTIRQVLDDPRETAGLPGARPGLRPWWPAHPQPRDLRARPGPAGEYCLHRVAPEHWVGLWRTEAVAKDDSPAPDIGPEIGTHR